MLKKSLLILLIGTGTVASLFADEIERDSRYIFVEHSPMKENDGPTAVKVLDAKTNKLVAELVSGNEDIDWMPMDATSSADGKYVAYSVGGASMGREIRLFRLTSRGPQRIPVDPVVTEKVTDIWHLYVLPVKFVKGQLVYEVSMNGSKNSQHFTKHYQRVFKIPGA